MSCSDHNCIFGHPGGVGTNGGCSCRRELRHVFGHHARTWVSKIEALRERAEKAEAACVDKDPS